MWMSSPGLGAELAGKTQGEHPRYQTESRQPPFGSHTFRLEFLDYCPVTVSMTRVPTLQRLHEAASFHAVSPN
jgi:hypothetical protein